MSVDDLVRLLGKIFLVPYYYSNFEISLNVAVTILGLVIGVYIPRHLDLRLLRWTALIVAVAAFLIYWAALYEIAGIFWYQTACRAVGIIALGIFVSPYPKSPDAEDDD